MELAAMQQQEREKLQREIANREKAEQRMREMKAEMEAKQARNYISVTMTSVSVTINYNDIFLFIVTLLSRIDI